MEEYCTHRQTMPCTRRSPARLVGRIPPGEAVDGEIFMASAWASPNLGYAYLSSRCSHLLVSRLYTDCTIANFWERQGGRTCYGGRSTASGGLRVYNYRDTSSRPQQSVEGHSLITQHGHNDAIQEEAAQRSVHAHGLHNTMFKAIFS